MLEKLKDRWNIKSNRQLAVVLLVFSLSGMSSLYVRLLVFGLLGVDFHTSLWIKVPLYVLIVFPAYQLLFLTIGTLLGQFRFVWEFEKKFFSRIQFLMYKPAAGKENL